MVEALAKLTVAMGDVSHGVRGLRLSPPSPDGLRSDSGSPLGALKQICAADRIEPAYERERARAPCDPTDIRDLSPT